MRRHFGEKIMTLREQIQALKLMGESTAKIAMALGVCEGTVCYHLHRQGHEDRRKNRTRKLDALAGEIEQWILAHHPLAEIGDAARPVYIRALDDWLRKEHCYAGSRRTVVRFVRVRYPRLRLRGPGRVKSSGALAHDKGSLRSWALRLLLGEEPISAVRDLVGDVPDLKALNQAAREGGCKKRRKALVVLATLRGVPPLAIAAGLRLSPRTVARYCETYRAGGSQGLFAPLFLSGAKSRSQATTARSWQRSPRSSPTSGRRSGSSPSTSSAPSPSRCAAGSSCATPTGCPSCRSARSRRAA
jgi:hypothetical protein